MSGLQPFGRAFHLHHHQFGFDRLSVPVDSAGSVDSGFVDSVDSAGSVDSVDSDSVDFADFVDSVDSVDFAAPSSVVLSICE